MGRQIQLYLLPEDVVTFEVALRKRGDVILLPRVSPSAEPNGVDTSVVANGEWKRSSCYLTSPQFLSTVQSKYVPRQDHWAIDPLPSTVVEFIGGAFNGKVLRRGRLYYTVSDYSADGAKFKKPEEFVKWAQSIVRLAKKVFRRDQVFDAYFGESATRWLAETGGKLTI